ncbi:XTP/dITP diphosphatase [[Eubacterium] cellulosolvens]
MHTKIKFVTSNFHKVSEVKEILSQHSISVDHINLKVPEIQSDSLEEIAKASSIEVAKIEHAPILVEDSGLFIRNLNGFPGPYSSYVLKTIGNTGILKLMINMSQREATFKSVIAFCNEKLSSNIFVGEVNGVISERERGKIWGFDPIFIPKGMKETFAEMPGNKKNDLSHRKKALEKFVLWYKSRY